MDQVYKCPTCGSTKTIVKPVSESPYTHMSADEFIQRLPDKIVCYYQGCMNYCVPVSGPLNR